METTMRTTPFQHLLMEVPMEEMKFLRVTEGGFHPPGWTWRLKDAVKTSRVILNSPKPSWFPASVDDLLHKQMAECAKGIEAGAIAGIVLAGDMEDFGWVRLAVEAHEMQHAHLYTILGEGISEKHAEELAWKMIELAGPFVSPYTKGFSTFRAIDELFADLAVVEAMLVAGHELDEAVESCDRYWEEIKCAWENGLRAGDILKMATTYAYRPAKI